MHGFFCKVPVIVYLNPGIWSSMKMLEIKMGFILKWQLKLSEQDKDCISKKNAFLLK